MIEQKQSSGKAAVIDELGGLVVRWQDATQKHDETVGEIYGLGPAERLCLSFLWRGPQTASAIAREVRLTPAAVTALIDRLENRGFVRRTADANDRRKVVVEAADATLEVTAEAYLPLRDAGATMLAKYSEAELRLFADVLGDMLRVQEEMTARLLARRNSSS
jgi:DNA-binding MarR family transcriptional regulator